MKKLKKPDFPFHVPHHMAVQNQREPRPDQHGRKLYYNMSTCDSTRDSGLNHLLIFLYPGLLIKPYSGPLHCGLG